MAALRVIENGVMLGQGSPGRRDGTSRRPAGLPVTPDEMMARLSRLRRAQIGGKRAPHKPLLHVRPGQPSVDVIHVNWHTIQVPKSHDPQAA
jgi:hypothetical protein